MFNVLLAQVDHFQRVYAIETTELDFVSFDDKNLQRRRKFVGERDTKLLYWSDSMSGSHQGPEIITRRFKPTITGQARIYRR